MRTLPTMMLMLALLAAPVALAQDEPQKSDDNATRPDPDGSADPSSPAQAPDDAAWVEDCPPDMMCAYQAPEDDEATYDGNCGGEVCAYGNESCIECSGPVDNGPGRVGPDDCIDCFQPPADEGATCMDGADANETCREDVQYIGGPGEPEPTRGPADGSCENCRGEDTQAETAGASEKAVPAPAALALIGIAAALVFVAMRK